MIFSYGKYVYYVFYYGVVSIFIIGINIEMNELWKEKFMNIVLMYGHIFSYLLLLLYY